MNAINKIGRSPGRLRKSLLIGAFLGLLPVSANPATATPWQKSDGEWITISGRVLKPQGDLFTLHYGEGTVPVEVDGFSPRVGAAAFRENDQVVVTGRIDHDRGHARQIEAGSVFVRNIQQSFFASAEDEEGMTLPQIKQIAAEHPGSVYQGVVQTYDTKSAALRLHTGSAILPIDLSQLISKTDPKKEEVRLQPGQQVAVFARESQGPAGLTAFAISKAD